MKYSLVVRDDEKSQQLAQYVKSMLKIDLDNENPDFVISLGGDGTILRAVHKYIDIIDKVVFFGINTGRLGFYTDWRVDEIDDLIEAIHKNDFMIGNHSLIKYSTPTESGYALNELTILNHMIVQVVDVYVDNKLFETCRGTGLCVSTTNGSTAYNKSLGGPIVDPQLNAFILTEIAAINSNAYRTLSSPLVLSSDHELTLKCYSAAMFTADQEHRNIKQNEEIKCRFSNKKVKFAKNKDTSFIDRIQKAFL